MEMYPEAIQIQMFKSATVLDSDDFRAIFKFFRTWLHCEMEIVIAVRQSKERAWKIYPEWKTENEDKI